MSCSPIFNNIDDKKYSMQVGFTNETEKLQFEGGKRYPRFYENLVDFSQKQYYKSSTKYSIKYDRIL